LLPSSFLLSFVVAITFLGIDLEAGLKKRLSGLWFEEVGCQAQWTEEAGCQACKKLSLGERGCWGSDFPEGAQLQL
jgi:hypothetical protein